MKSRVHIKAFTLTEVIVGLVVVSIIGAAAWMAVNILSPASQATLLRIKAEHLITLSQEELHQYLQNQTNFDSISPGWPTSGNCTFDQTNNACGFADVKNQFPEFTRTLQYMGPPNSTTNLKEFVVHVTWQESGKPKFKDSVIFLVRPSDPLPGNIYGKVTDTNGTVLSTTKANNLQIVAQKAPASVPTSAQSVISLGEDGGNENYTYLNPNTGYYALPAGGTWEVTATANGYVTSGPQEIYINGDQKRADFKMKPLPKPATINVNLVDIDVKGPTPSFNGNSSIHIDEGGKSPSDVSTLSSSPSSVSFSVPFNDEKPNRCFTISTLKAFFSGWVGQFTCNNFSYQLDGWSSAQDNGIPPNCGAPWAGGTGSDNICVTPGQTLPVSVPLVQVPTATVTVNVKNQVGQPISSAWFDIFWAGVRLSFPAPGQDTPGQYTITLPALGDFSTSTFAQIYTYASVPVLQCCGQSSTTNMPANPPSQMVGPLPPDQSMTAIIDVPPTTPPLCGNATGFINDAKTGASVDGANVILSQGGLRQTNGGGNYNFQCSQTPPFSIPSGNSTISVTDNNYYSFPGSQNFSYYNASSQENISANQLNNLGKISLWPIGQSKITGTVEEVGQNGKIILMSGVPVVLTLASGGCPSTTTVGGSSSCTATTDSSGHFEFDTVPETWPPTALIGNSNYNQNSRGQYGLSIAASGTYNQFPSPSQNPPPAGTSFALTADVPYNVTIILNAKGGT